MTFSKNFWQTRRGTVAQGRDDSHAPAPHGPAKRKIQVRALLKTIAGARLNWDSGMWYLFQYPSAG